MVTTSRLIVVLRGELGLELASANKRLLEIKSIQTKVGDGERVTRKFKDIECQTKRITRLESTIHALGRLTLGDIEIDTKHNF